jgi:antitoxin component YwqK of YwqJK toxin-antitoxin module
MANGKLNGLYKLYHENGQGLYIICSCNSDKKYGECKRYYQNGELIEHSIYENGKKIEDKIV